MDTLYVKERTYQISESSYAGQVDLNSSLDNVRITLSDGISIIGRWRVKS